MGQNNFGTCGTTVRLARLGWLPRQAQLPLRGGWRGTGTILYHWPWNIKSTMRKDRSSQKQNKPGSSREHSWLPTTSQLHFFALRNLYLGQFKTMAAGDCPTVMILVQPY